MSVKQISVFLENVPGSLDAMTEVLANNNIDMRALSMAETRDFGIVRIIVNNSYNAATVLKDAGYVYSVTPVVCVKIPDTPGGLNNVLKILSKAGANIEYTYAFLGGKKNDGAYMIFRMENSEAGVAALKAEGIQIADREEIENL